MVISYIESRREIHSKWTRFPKTSEWLHCSLRGLEVAVSIFRTSLFLPFFLQRRKCPLNKSLPRELSRTTEHVQWLPPPPKKSLPFSFYGEFIILQNVGARTTLQSFLMRKQTIRSDQWPTRRPVSLPCWFMCVTFGKCPQSLQSQVVCVLT